MMIAANDINATSASFSPTLYVTASNRSYAYADDHLSQQRRAARRVAVHEFIAVLTSRDLSNRHAYQSLAPTPAFAGASRLDGVTRFGGGIRASCVTKLVELHPR